MAKNELKETKDEMLHEFHPSKKLLKKFNLITATIMVPIILGTLTLFLIGMVTNEIEPYIAGALLIGVEIVVWFIIYLLLKKWINSFYYEFTADEIIVHKGWITKSLKIVPYRTITNFHKKIGPYDRLTGLATLEIETAGKSGSQHGPEEKIEGIEVENVDTLLKTVRSKIRHLKGTAAITQDGDKNGSVEGILYEILKQMKEIKQAIKDD